MFLPGAFATDEIVIPAAKGRILLDRPGDIYVRGLWVGRFQGYQCGFDLDDLELDRDRRMANAYMLGILVSRLWVAALGDPAYQDKALARVSGLLSTGAADVTHLGWALENTYDETGAAARAALVGTFHAKWGDKAIPVLTTTEADRAEGAGLTPVPMERAAKEALEAALGVTFEAAVTAARRARVRVLSPAEIRALGWHPRWEYVLGVAKVLEVTTPISIAEFDHTAWGLWRPASGDIALSTRCFAAPNPGQALVTLAHEWAHARCASTSHGATAAATAEDTLAGILGWCTAWPEGQP